MPRRTGQDGLFHWWHRASALFSVATPRRSRNAAREGRSIRRARLAAQCLTHLRGFARRKSPVRRLETAKLFVGPLRPHETPPRVFCAAKQQMPYLVRDRSAQEGGQGSTCACGCCANRPHIDRHQYAAALSTIEHRLSERDEPSGARRAVDQPEHELAPGDSRFGARRSADGTRHTTICPLDRNSRTREDMCRLGRRWSKLLDRNGRVIVGSHRHRFFSAPCGLDRHHARHDHHHERNQPLHGPTVRLRAGCLNACEVTRRRNVGDALIRSRNGSYVVFTFW